MNETLSVFLDFTPEDYGIEKIIDRMDQLLENNGWIYTGLSNMYRAMDGLTRDETIYKVMHTLDHTEWLQPYHPRILIGNLVDVMKLSNIDVSGMRAPSKRKLERYEEYYNLTKSLPHSIIVDEKGRIRDGYITYLLAWKYSEKPKILSTWRNRPLKKLVIGKHVYWDKEHASEKSKKSYCWIYDLRESVIPGDILLVDTARGPDYMQVSEITYVTGIEACSRYRKVKRNETTYV